MSIPSIEPAQFYAGDTVKWSIGPNDPIASGEGTQWNMLFSGPGIMRDYLVTGTGTMADYPPSAGWQLHYVAKNQNEVHTFDAEANDSGNGYDISVDTSDWNDGTYFLLGYVDKGENTERHVVRSRRIIVFPNPAAAGPADFRSVARQIYEKIKADEKNGVRVAEYTIGTVHCKYSTPAERQTALQYWAHQVAAEEGKLPNFYGVSFSL